jgi:hypothetical protein
LDDEDVAFLKKLAKQDEFIRQLAASTEGAEILGRILGLVAVGPVKLVVQWNQVLIRGWRQANASLEALNKRQVCDSITERYMETKALQFFDGLYKARGC